MSRRPFAPPVLALLLAVLAASCGGGSGPAAPEPAGEPVTIYAGGPIYTALDDTPMVEAVAVAGGEIIATGALDLIRESAGPDAREIDLGGAAMYPGFVDAHAHLLGVGLRELTLNLEGTASIADLAARIDAAVAAAAPGEVVYGRGWIETGWPEGRMPTRDDLDPVSPDNPVVLGRADGHALVANSAALNAAGIGPETPDPAGGQIERDGAGRATGVLIDNAQAPALALIAAPAEATKREAYARASEVYAAYGWTGLHNMSVDPDNLPLLEAAAEAGAFRLRAYNALDPDGLALLEAEAPRRAADGRIITRAVKVYMDGALGSRGALLSRPYADRPDASGLLLMGEDEAAAIFARARAAGVQVCAHAIGDRANRLLLDWMAAAFADAPEAARAARWRDEHAQILHTDDIPRFAELGVIASMQPSHAIGDFFFAPDRLGPDRLAGAYAWRSLIEAGAVVAGGSDAPVERGDPRIEFYAAVARRGLDGTQTPDWRPAEAVSRADALKMFTRNAAYASFQEDRLGAIAPGMRADFTVFSRDIMTIPERDILSVETVLTVVDGEVVHDGR